VIKDKKLFTIISGILFFFLVISVIFMNLSDDRKTRRVLFFPRGIERELVGEVRYLPQRKDQEEAISQVVKGLLLGPAEYQNTLLVPRGSKLNTILLRENVLYLDFSRNVILDHEDQSSYIEEIYEGIKKTVLYNFRYVKEVRMTIEGQIPFKQPFQY